MTLAQIREACNSTETGLFVGETVSRGVVVHWHGQILRVFVGPDRYRDALAYVQSIVD